VIALLLVLCPLLLLFDTRLGYASIALAIVLLCMKRMDAAKARGPRPRTYDD
jgi:hypothetical protein